jgi:hypothetical protein
MKASEIVSKLKEVLLSSTEEVENQEAVQLEENTEEVQEEVQLQESLDEEVSEEAPVEEVEMSYATKEELAEVKAMVESIMGKLDANEESIQDVPEELSSQEVSEEPLVHSPEDVTEKNSLNLYAQKRELTTFDRVLSRIIK